ncbi:hypothetical protein BofuT4_P143310.1 [Botrytis cinerea T4]|uniref:Uncharacterized protein n=1 Tax=Botryotinia fuckeliana (strain T4) TaxID=999810 RepID=G2YZM1_BOTF4|nr:hypothetical protein BofuT4_P143310.1 [Botrytis cinerea T4]
MAPSLLDTQPVAPHQLSSPSSQKPIDRKVFPDGIKTSGQHPPLYDQLRPYSDFPKEITGETVWKAEDYINNPERWVHVFNEEEIAELSAVADKFIADKIPLTGHFPPLKTFYFTSIDSNRNAERKGLYPLQRISSREMG